MDLELKLVYYSSCYLILTAKSELADSTVCINYDNHGTSSGQFRRQCHKISHIINLIIITL